MYIISSKCEFCSVKISRKESPQEGMKDFYETRILNNDYHLCGDCYKKIKEGFRSLMKSWAVDKNGN